MTDFRILCLVLILSLSAAAEGDDNSSAESLYEQGMEAYTSANCVNDKYLDALADFKQARATYISAEDYEQVKNCDYIINRTNEAIQSCAQQMMTSLDDSIRDANIKLVLVGDNCSEYAGIERLLNETKNESLGFYAVYAADAFVNLSEKCDKLLLKVEEQEETCIKVKRLEDLYNEAEALYSDGKYADALVLAQKAKEQEDLLCSGWKCEKWSPTRVDRLIENITSLYQPPLNPCSSNEVSNYSKCLMETRQHRADCEARGDWGCVTKTDRLIDSLNKSFVLFNKSNGYYDAALEHYRIADFKDALSDAMKAKEGYSNLSRSREVALCDKLISDIRAGNATKAEADAHFADDLLIYVVAFVLAAAAVLFLIHKRK